jgi:hypothetical protein
MRGMPRRIVSIFAAYALALQALLTAFSALPAAALGARGAEFTICRPAADRDGAPVQPVSHQSCLACLAGHCAAAAGLDRAAGIVPRPLPAGTAAPVVHYAERVTLTPRPRPHGPRAPPAA